MAKFVLVEIMATDLPLFRLNFNLNVYILESLKIREFTAVTLKCCLKTGHFIISKIRDNIMDHGHYSLLIFVMQRSYYVLSK